MQKTLHAPLVVIGGGLGGTAAALTAARLGRHVILTEESDWLGGQLTNQAVPPDEHQWIDSHPISPSYSELRTRIRDHYRRNYPLTRTARELVNLNPGAGFVSRLCHEPRVAELVIGEMLSPLQASGLLTVLIEHEPIRVHRDGSRITAVTLRDLRSGDEVHVEGDYFADATELGDLLELGAVEHVIGAESSADTGELHAPSLADPLDQQATTWCAALELRLGEDHTIQRPAGYERWRSTVPDFWPGPQLSWDDIEPITLQKRTRSIFAGPASEAATSEARDLWHYRRILASNHMNGWHSGDITLVNWPQVDYWDAPLLGVTEAARQSALAEARELTRSFIYWMQTEAPRPDGGAGYPELLPRGDVLGTNDGLAKRIYVRESRRIRAEFTVTEAHIGREMRGDGSGSAVFNDAVGIGFYRIDLHPSTSGRNYVDIDTFPFQIPLGSLLPRDMDNLLAANKNIGTTHISNGAYRLHPVEWSIGEAVGALAAYSLQTRRTPKEVWSTPNSLQEYQHLLTRHLGITLAWPEDIRTNGSTSAAVPTRMR